MPIASLSGLYPTGRDHALVARRLRTASLWAWFLLFGGVGWAIFDLVEPRVALAAITHQPLDIDVVATRAAVDRWTVRLGLLFLLALAVTASRFVWALNLPFFAARDVFAVVRRLGKVPPADVLLVAILDREASRQGFRLETVEAFLQRADLQDWPSRTRLIRQWLRLQLHRMDRQIAEDAEGIVTIGGRRYESREVSLRLHSLDRRLSQPPP